MMLACGYSLSHDHQGFRPFGPHHREAAWPVEPAEASIKVHCDHQRVPSGAFVTASTAVMEVVNLHQVLLLGSVEMGQAAYMG